MNNKMPELDSNLEDCREKLLQNRRINTDLGWKGNKGISNSFRDFLYENSKCNRTKFALTALKMTRLKDTLEEGN